jgi:DNA-binding MarR family transcriptional regulator
VTSSISHVISVLINYQSTDIMRKTASLTKARSPKKQANRQKSRSNQKSRARISLQREATSAPAPTLPNARIPPPGSGKRGEQGHIAYLLRQAQAATRLTLERALADLGITTPQFAVLTMLNAYPGLSGADVARVALLTPQTVGVIIGNLERDGAIKKTAHPVHGRVLQWTLTRRGSDVLDKCRDRVNAVERRLVTGLGAKAEVTIRRWLSKIAADLHEDS